MLPDIHPNPQNIAPTSSPIFCDNERSGGFEGENSLVIAGRIKEVTTGHRLSLAQPNPGQQISIFASRQGSRRVWKQHLAPRQTSDDDEKLPLVPAHANVLDRAVQYLRFAFVHRVDGPFEQGRHKLFFIWELIVEARLGVYTRRDFGLGTGLDLIIHVSS